MEPTSIVFLTAAAAAAALHALIPDHWLPFVVMGRSRGWSLGKTLVLAALSSVVHVCLAVGLGLATYLLGREGAEDVARHIGESLEVLSSLALIVFGLVYGTYSWYRERQHHAPRAAGSEGTHAGHPHHHGHLLERWFSGELSAVALVTVIGVSPCALALPILLAGAAQLGLAGVVWVAGTFATATLVVTLLVTLFGVLSVRKMEFPFLTRYGDLTTGAIIVLVGSVLLMVEVFGH